MTGQTEPLKERLRRKDVSVGSWLSFADTHACEMMARLGGFDWLVIDMEHTATGTEAMARLIQIIDLCDIDPLVRVGSNDTLLIKRALDCGARGVIVPQVNTVEDARRAVEAAHYPPTGLRGAGLFRAQDYGASFADYQRRAPGETVVIVQIEHHVGVDNVDAIMAVPGVDAFFIGPYDLSASLGKAGQFDAPEVLARLETLAAYAGEGAKAAGIHIVHPDPAELAQRIAMGFSFIAYGTDMLFLESRLREARQAVTAAKGPAR